MIPPPQRSTRTGTLFPNTTLFRSTRRYLRANPDVAAAGMNPLVHYLRFGRGEGRPCFPVGNYTEDDNPPLIVARSTREIDRDMQAIRRTRLDRKSTRLNSSH